MRYHRRDTIINSPPPSQVGLVFYIGEAFEDLGGDGYVTRALRSCVKSMHLGFLE